MWYAQADCGYLNMAAERLILPVDSASNRNEYQG
jgi:hypothetical protein